MSSPKKSEFSDNFIGAVAYLTPFPAFFFLAIRRYNKRPYVRFHAWQSLVLSAFVVLFYLALTLILPLVRPLGHRVYLGLMVLVGLVALTAFIAWLCCLISALNGKRFKLPILGDWADEQAYR